MFVVSEKKSSNEKLDSTENGRNNIKTAARLRQDDVYHRISVLPEDGE